MLVLARKDQEKIVLVNSKTGETITVVHCGHKPNGDTKFGIQAGPEWKIWRTELLERAKSDE